ncbi:head GIN domain-containing protein [Mesonia ostreae]|uniref:Head GIN domain-containing protein n=1 Tax=Mesonia ostreae TaxID=861110 RepID=A0ABU2KJ03_9FLAO|nr:head GIN domain-containing protein [Mesonia ostreae]MDT0294691.1 head GIN domain-containing protein [Mesonia ostreae]
MKKIILLVVVAISAFSVKAQEEIKIEKDFKEVKIFDKIEAVLIPSSENKIIASGFDKDEITAQVKGNTLHIKLSLSNIWSENNTQVKVYYKDIHTVDVNEASFAELKEFKGEKLILRAQEGGRIYAVANLKELDIKAVTGGSIETEGSVDSQLVEIRTGGGYEGKEMHSKNTEANLKAGGYAEIFVSDYCKAKVTAGGSIDVYGDPKKLDKKTSLGGKIRKRS